MGKMVGIYLSNDEEKALDKFCQDHNCTSYSVLKAGLHFILDESCRKKELQPEGTGEPIDNAEKKPKKSRRKPDLLEQLFMDDEEETEESE